MSYSKIDPASHDTVISSLDLFQTPESETSTLHGRTRHITPTTQPNSPQLDFDFRTPTFEYLNPTHTRLLVELHVEKSDGGDIGDDDTAKVIPTTYLLHTLFQIAALSINNNDVSYEANYPHTAYLEALLSRSMGYKKTIAQSAGWFEDDLGVLDESDLATANADAVKQRKKLISSNKRVQLCDRLHIPFFNQDRYIPANTSIKLSLTRASHKLALLTTDKTSTTDYKIVIDKCALLIREVTINPAIINAHNTLLANGNKIMYPLNDVDSQMFTISAGKVSERIPIRINQQRPKRVTVALLDHEAKNGDLTKDPFKFQHFDLRRISLDDNGTPIPSKPIDVNFTNGTIAHAFHNLAMTTGRAFGNGDHGITMEKFMNGHTVFPFDLTPDSCDGAGTHLINYSSLYLDLQFGSALPETVSVLIHVERDDLVKINNEKTIERISRN